MLYSCRGLVSGTKYLDLVLHARHDDDVEVTRSYRRYPAEGVGNIEVVDFVVTFGYQCRAFTWGTGW